MKQKILYSLAIVMICILSACGSTVPTLSPEELASTAMAQALIIITQTQGAMPTATPLPPSNTPEPTFTLPPPIILPTLPIETATPIATQDECNQPPPIKPQGAQVNVEFTNLSKGQVNLSFGMNTPNDKKECVTYSFTMGSGRGVLPVRVLAGCYWGFAWVSGDKPSTARTGGTLLCMSDTSGVYHILITEERIYFK